MARNTHDAGRRRLLRQSLAIAGAAALSSPGRALAQSVAVPVSDPHIAQYRNLSRIAFGSCADAARPQPVWEQINARNNDLFIFLGDNIYADTRDRAVLAAKYAELAAVPGFAKLRASTPVFATWDDHDYGENDAGGDYPMKDESRRMFLEFWKEPLGSPRWERDGVYGSWLFSDPRDPGKRVQLILLDLRYNRTAMTPREPAEAYEKWAREQAAAGREMAGPYLRNPDPKATMLGERQWQWFESQLEVEAQLRLIGSSVQVLADFTGWESWANFARDRDRLFDAIRRKRANGVLFLSGDIHYAELSRQDMNVPYTLWDLTSSGLTEEWRVPTPNANRASEVVADANFGTIDIDWKGPATTISIGIVDATGKRRISKDIELASLAVT